MEKINKKIIITIIFIIINLSMFANNSYAENETNNKNDNLTSNSATTTTNTSNVTNSTSSSTTTSQTSKTKTDKKSSNANLNNLGIKPHDFTGFKSGTTTYNVTVPNDTNSIEIYATAQVNSAKISGIGTKSLEIGENKIEVLVTAEDGTTKTYTINVTRQDDKTANTEVVQNQYSGDGLASLEIKNVTLAPSFDTTMYEYTIKYIGEETKLDITATTTDPYYTMEIVGNEDLQEGENIINILVSDPDDENIATYQITVNKSLVDEEALEKEREQQKKKIITVGGIAIAVVIIIIVIGIIIHKRNQEWETEYDKYDEYDEENNNQLEDYDENMNYINDEEEKELTKEQARERFLNNYDNKEELTEEVSKKKKHKGKRYK